METVTMMSKAEVESLSSYNSEVEEKQARHIDIIEVILMFLLRIINMNILTIMMFLYHHSTPASNPKKLNDPKLAFDQTSPLFAGASYSGNTI